MAPVLVDLPQEVLGSILSFLAPREVSRFGRTCRQAHGFISPDNQLLWRDTFLHVFDDPNIAWAAYPPSCQPQKSDWDWHQELKSRSHAIKALRRRWTEDSDKDNSDLYIQAILSLIDTAKPRLSPSELAEGKIARVDDRSSMNLQLLDGILVDNEVGLERMLHDGGKPTSSRASDDIGRPQTRAMTSATRDRNRSDASRRLHALYGMSTRDKRERRYFYRRYVYNWTLTNAGTDFGPYNCDGSGRINWLLLEAAMVCIWQGFQDAAGGYLSAPQGLFYSIPYRTLPDPALPEDWARVTGVWLGTYAFLDYSRLLAFNAGPVYAEGGHSFDLRDEEEVCGDLLRMELALDNSVCEDPVLKSNVPICRDLPPLYFTGTSQGSEYPSHPTTTIKGFAALAVGGREVKWKLIVEYHGVDQWQLEAVQPGGIRSGGIFGVWSNVEHEENSPVGPFCYFPQELCKSTSVVLAGL